MKKDNSDTVLTMLKKLFVTLCFFSLSTEIFSETYVCSYDAKQHSETPEGGVQIVSYERKGKGFIDTANKFSFTIGYESTNNLFLVDSDQFDNGGVMSVHINKQTMEYGVSYATLESIKKEEHLSTFGKCVVVN
ncbi:hypothetical protein N9F35_01375 [Gammaproteobacteria bacterium]|nr:hypothetical protein [Gammaproteobacteria bacterium]